MAGKENGPYEGKLLAMKKYFLEIVVFISGASLMMLEIVASRILAPYVGTSIIVWTSIIGIVLASLSLGYFLGGRFADRSPKHGFLGKILILASLSIALAHLITPFITTFLTDNFLDLRFIAFLSSLLIFGPTSLFLGMVTPYAIKLRLKSLEKTGSISGNLFAISTVGSILGTFATGFFLIPFFGTRTILVVVSLLLLFAALLIFALKKSAKKVIVMVVILIFAVALLFRLEGKKSSGVVLEKDTLYNKILLEKRKVKDTDREVLLLRTGISKQSAMYLDDKYELAAEYTKYFRLGGLFNPNLKKVLKIGGGAYSYPKDFLKRNPEGHIDVVEIDPGISKVARDHFYLKDNPRLNIYHQDARVFLNRTGKVYDGVYIDAYGSGLSTPFHLTTIEAVKKIHDLLGEDGVVIVNIAASFEGERSKFLKAEIKTYETFFPQIYTFATSGAEDPYKYQNIILVALKSTEKPEFTSTNPLYSKLLDNLWEKPLTSELPVLTDNYAPVEHYSLIYTRKND